MIEMEFFQFSNKKEEDQIEGKGVLAYYFFQRKNCSNFPTQSKCAVETLRLRTRESSVHGCGTQQCILHPPAPPHQAGCLAQSQLAFSECLGPGIR
jgi:hypothetical protein